MQTPEQRAEFFAAYEAYKDIRERHEDEMRAIVRGEKVADDAHLFAQAAQVMAAHQRFNEASDPFIGGQKLAG